MSHATNAGEIILATDLSARCDRALERAHELSKLWQTTLHVVTAVEPDLHEPSWRAEHRPVVDAARYDLEDQLKDLGDTWRLTVETGSPADAVLAVARRETVRLVVTGVARNELLGRSDPGRTVRCLLRELPTPLLVVRRRAHGPYNSILHATDLSDTSERAMATIRAWFPKAELTLLYAYRVAFAGFRGEQEAVKEARREAQSNAASFLARLKALPGVALPENILVEYGPIEALAYDLAEAHGTDLLVIASHLQDKTFGIGWPRHVEQLLMTSPTDVLIIPDAG